MFYKNHMKYYTITCYRRINKIMNHDMREARAHFKLMVRWKRFVFSHGFGDVVWKAKSISNFKKCNRTMNAENSKMVDVILKFRGIWYHRTYSYFRQHNSKKGWKSKWGKGSKIGCSYLLSILGCSLEFERRVSNGWGDCIVII
jgi:hypothetical protein